MKKRDVILEDREPSPDAAADELAKVLLARFGLLARKIDGSIKMEKILLELNEKKKASQRDKNPELAVMPVEEMALVSGVARQTVYDHLGRWLYLDVIKKTSFVSGGRVVIGYELNGPTVEAAFRKAESRIHSLLDGSFKILDLLRAKIKRDKLTSINESEEEK